MHQPSPSTRLREPARSRGLVLPGLAVAACALLAVGCEEERHEAVTRPKSRAADVVGVDLGDQGRESPQPKSRPAPKPQAPRKPESIIGQRTQKIENANAELKTGQAKVGSTRIVARDPITLPGNAYRAIVGQLAIGQIKQAIDLYQAENGRYPKDYNEFMEVIIKANNIVLPTLPPYQEYGYDAKEHQLIILEYEDRKNPPPL
jgi:hypothetical protein